MKGGDIMRKYKISTNELLYHCSKEIEAESKEEAKNKYFEMIASGDVDVNKSDYCDITITPQGKPEVKDWLDVAFESSSGLTEEFAKFNREIKSYVKDLVKDDFELANWNRGHFYFSGFLKNKKNGEFVYFSASDVRHFSNGWYNNLLIRTAKHDKDYSGGSNASTKLTNLATKANELTN